MQENAFLASARSGKNAIWRYGLTILLIVTAFFVVTLVVGLAILIATGGQTDLAQLPATAALLLLGLPFGSGLFTLWFGISILHQRRFRSLITPHPAFSWQRFLLSAGLWLAVSGLSDLVLGAFVTPGNYVWHWDARAFISYAVLALLLIPIQSFTEELIARGYLMQGLGLLFRRAWPPLLLSSAIFAALHSFNPEIVTYGFPVMIASYLSMGLFLGWITLRNEGLEAALGLHTANNLYAALLVNYPSSAITSPALFTMRTFNPYIALLSFYIMAALYLLLFRWLDRKGDR